MTITTYIKKIKKCFQNPNLIGLMLLSFKTSRIIPDENYIRLLYRLNMNKKLNLLNPSTFNEKLQWLKLHDRNPLYTSYVDKYEVREFIEKTIGKECLVPLLGVYDEVEDVDFSILPDQFVLKPTHTSGNVIICRDKTKLDLIETKKTLIKWLKREYFWYQREWPYKNIKPRIICEELIKTNDGKPPKDYKIFCFNGEPKFVFVASDRGIDTKFDFFDIDWNRQSLKQHYPNSDYIIEKPRQWEKMLELAKILSQGIPHVRVDFYIDSSESIYFGELTFYHMSGLHAFTPESYDYLLGSWIDLSLVEKNQKEDANVWKEK